MATNGGGSGSRASEIKFNIWREQASVFQDVSGYYFGSVNLTGVDRSQRTDAIFVTTDYFHLFGLPIAQGRGFTAEEERPNGPHVVVSAMHFWKRVFGGNPNIVGKIVSLSGDPYEVVGIMVGGVQTKAPELPMFWLPFPIDPNSI